MAYIKIRDIEGKEHEHQVVNLGDVFISENFGRFETISEQIERQKESLRDEIETEMEGDRCFDDDVVVSEYFECKTLSDVYKDQCWSFEDLYDAIKKELKNKYKGAENIALLQKLLAEVSQ